MVTELRGLAHRQYVAMTTQIAKQPPQFVFGSDFDIFLQRISANTGALTVENKKIWDVFLAFLDDQALYARQAS